jgi:hypothetical protein
VALRQLLKDAPQGTIIEIYHHSSKAYWDSIGSIQDSLRAEYYPVWSGIPFSVCDGVDTSHSTGTIRGDSLKFASWYNQRRAVSSPLTITITGIYNRSTRQGRVKATITATAPITVTNLKIHYRLLETLPYHWQTIDTMDNAVRLNFPSISGVPLTIANGQTKADSQAFTMLPGWNMNNVRIAVFVQSDQTREILQGGWAPLTGFSGVEGGAPVEPVGNDVVLAQNRPNPAKGSTEIAFSLPKAENVRLVVYDAQGRLVKTLAEGTRSAGKHQISVSGLESGVYFYRLEAGSTSLTRRMVVTK